MSIPLRVLLAEDSENDDYRGQQRQRGMMPVSLVELHD